MIAFLHVNVIWFVEEDLPMKKKNQNLDIIQSESKDKISFTFIIASAKNV